MLTTGCYSTIVAPPQSARGDVEVALSDQGAVTMVPALGPRVAQIDGRVIASGDSALTLAVTRVRRLGGGDEAWPADRVALPLAAVRDVRIRRLSTSRTVAFSAASALALFLLGRQLGGADASGGRSTGGQSASR